MLIDRTMEKEQTLHSCESHGVDTCYQEGCFWETKVECKESDLFNIPFTPMFKTYKAILSLIYKFKHMWGKSIKTERALQVQEAGFSEERGEKLA